MEEIRKEIREEIEQKLLDIERQKHVKILYAVESGSRSWGFASPDSDYDVRFIYVRTKEDYLKLEEEKDVIEWQLDEVLDINGWDLRKALQQFHRGNAGLFEWGNSPIVYRTTKMWQQIYDVARQYFSVKSASYHYYGTAKSTYSQHLMNEQVKYKKYFYALRPLLAGLYIQKFKCAPPVLFDELMKLDMPLELRDGIEKLLEIKKKSDEKETGTQIAVIQNFIAGELDRQKSFVENIVEDRRYEWDSLNTAFLKSLEG